MHEEKDLCILYTNLKLNLHGEWREVVDAVVVQAQVAWYKEDR